MKYNLPSLKALRAVETVGRHGSITSAVNELHVTAGAVSRHIALLEDYFGCKLFTRHANGLILTEVGRLYVERLSEAFTLIDQASSQILRAGDRTTFVVRALGAFSSEWLLPRIAQFENMYPEISVSIRGKLSEVDFDTDEADVGIIVGHEKPTNLESVKLYTPYITPVISPGMLRRGTPIKVVNDLKNYRLLHAMNLVPSWAQWLERVDPNHDVEATEGHWLERTTQITQAVKQDVGIGLGQFLLVGDDIIKGNLVAPFSEVVASPASIYLVWPKRRKTRPEIALFKDWLSGAIKQYEDKLAKELPHMRLLDSEA
jgi:LysR family glycine cleavage system transcriptional activator